ncbi:conserved hypothetical protein [Ignisphaera aggregans DSM 17230]|uniref:Type IV pilin n=1 Tax=Ignisphaera aggregans (strain DSM 17230 / JCM 13409 / AQ1.S1) TaxID=583356 RepID=E0SRU9_IGNAA|nr:conserved hypothetical protein [Ignisphaera aggregans DSM 17230]
MKLSRGIEPIIATIIIVAVTLVIAIAVIGWIMGWWGALTGGQEMLQVFADSRLRITSPDGNQAEAEIHVANKGGATATIYKVEIAGTDCKAETGDFDTKDLSKDTAGNIVVPPGKDGTFTASITCSSSSLTPGATYNVKIYTKGGSTLSINLVAEQAP